MGKGLVPPRVSLPDGIELSMAEAGAGAPRLLLVVHGFCGAKEDFTDWLDPLAALGWHAVTFDLRGHGASAHPPGEASYSLAILERDVANLVRHLGWDRFVLLGHSMGGMVAQLFALDHPAQLDGLILMDTSHGAPDGIDPALVALGREVVRSGGTAALLAAQKALGPGPLDTEAHQALLARRPGFVELQDSKLLACSADMWIALSDEMLRQPDRLAALAQVAVPTLVVVGAEDAAFLSQCRRMASTIPGATLTCIAGAGHSPQFEQPDAWWAALAAFLNSL
ncbi:MAG: alpha/beta fold hydrolase [Acidimicrobiales bacterium]